MAPPLRVTLDQAAHDELERRYHTTHDATTRTRYQMLLLRADGHRVPEVAQLTCCSPDTVRRVLKRYLAGGPDAVPHRPYLGQRLVQAPGKNFTRCGFGLVDWRDGHLDWALAEGRRAVPFCDQLRRAVARSRSRGRIAMVILDNLGIHTPKGSRLLRGLLAELGEDLVLVYTPTYDPDANRIEWLWRALRRAVTHTHRRQRLDDLLADADRWARTIPAAKVLSQIGSPFAPDPQPVVREELNHAA